MFKKESVFRVYCH
jgi:PUA domain protein